MSSEIIHEQEVKISLLKKQRVTVKVWTSMANINSPGHNVGHVAVETNKKYMSLWPKQRYLNQPSAKESEGSGVYSPIGHQFNEAIQDILYEGRDPEYLLCLYTLEPDNIEEEFTRLQAELQGWALVGGLLSDNAESCASLAWKLLEAGGIRKLISITDMSSVSSSQSSIGSLDSTTETSLFSFNTFFSKNQAAGENKQRALGNALYSSEMAVSLNIKSPDAVAEYVKQAKLTELKREPMTQNITYDKETILLPERGNYCTIA